MADRQEAAYVGVAATLRDEITAGVHPQGKKLDSISMLAKRFGVGKGVIERALAVLESEGLITTRQGWGAKVGQPYDRIPRETPGRLLRAHWGSGQAIQDHDVASRSRDTITKAGEGPIPDWAARSLRIDTGSPAVYRNRTIYVDNRIVQLSVSWIPLGIGRETGLAFTDAGPGGTYARLEEAGYIIDHFDEDAIGRAATPQELREMNIARRAPMVFEILRETYTDEGVCVEVNRMILDADVYRLKNRIWPE